MKTMEWKDYLNTQQDVYLDEENNADNEIVYENDGYTVWAQKSLHADGEHFFSGSGIDFAMVSNNAEYEYLCYDCTLNEIIKSLAPEAETMQDVADYYNNCESLDTQALEAMIEANGWVSDCDTEWGVCHNDTERVIINDEGQAVVVSMEKNSALAALMDAKRQIDVACWWIPTNDRGSGSAGVNFLKKGEELDAYIRFAFTGDNTDCPNTNSIEYVPVADFGDTENEVLDKIMQYAHICNVERDEVLGFIVCHEGYHDMPYTFYITHIRG